MIDEESPLLESFEQLAVGYAALGDEPDAPRAPFPWSAHLKYLAIELAITATALGAAELALR